MAATEALPNRRHLVEERPPGPGLSDFALWLRANACSENTIEDQIGHVEDFTRHRPTFPAVNPMHITAWIGREGLAPWRAGRPR